MSKPTVQVLEANMSRNVESASDRESRINNCYVEASDCALSMWANDSMNSLYRTQLELAKNDWKHDFMVLYHHGKRAIGKEVQTRFGSKWIISGEWFPSYSINDTGRKLKNFQAHGFSWVKESLDAHAQQFFGSYIGAPVSTGIAPDERDIITCYFYKD